MSNATTDVASPSKTDLPATQFRYLEWFLFAATIVGGIGVAGSAVGGLASSILTTILVGLFSFASLIVVPWLVHSDAKRVHTLDLDWSPRPAWLAAVTFLLTLGGGLAVELVRMPVRSALAPLSQLYYGLGSGPPEVHTMVLTASAPLGAVYYLGRRYRHLDGARPSRYWWLVLPAVVTCAVSYLAAELHVGGSLNRVAALTMVVASMFPIGAYMDALYLRVSENEWNPNPALQFFLAYLSILVFPISLLYPAYATYHLGRRWLGRPS